MRKVEKLFPELMNHSEKLKCQLVSEIRVPKNLMYLTDKLPAASYDFEPESKIHKNKSEIKFKLPKLANSMVPASYLSQLDLDTDNDGVPPKPLIKKEQPLAMLP